MRQEYYKHTQSQETQTKPSKGFIGSSFQFVQEYFTAGEQLVIGALMTYKDCSVIFPSQETLAIKAHVSARTAWSALNKLKKYKLITAKRRMNASSIYSFTTQFLFLARPLISGLYLSSSLLLSSIQSENRDTCELIRNKEFIKIETRDGRLCTNRKKEQAMVQFRTAIQAIAKKVTLNNIQRKELENYSDTQLYEALAIIKSKRGLINPAGYLINVLKNSHNSAVSDNGYDDNLRLFSNPSLTSGKKSYQTKLNQNQNKDIQSSFKTPSAHQSIEIKSRYPVFKSQRYCKVDPDKWDKSITHSFSSMSEEAKKFWVSACGPQKRPNPQEYLPYDPNNFSVFATDSNGNFFFNES